MKIPLETMTIYSGPLRMFGAKVQIAAREKDLDFRLVLAAIYLKYQWVLVLRPQRHTVLPGAAEREAVPK